MKIRYIKYLCCIFVLCIMLFGCGKDKENDEETVDFTGSRSKIVLIQNYSNYNGEIVNSGFFVDYEGKAFEYNFTDNDYVDDKDLINRLEEIYKNNNQTPDENYSEDKVLSIAALADKIDLEAKFTRKNIACDYGQRTIYVLNGKGEMVEICSYGDNVEDSTDKNAIKVKSICDDLGIKNN